jgi:hypothetical protein
MLCLPIGHWIGKASEDENDRLRLWAVVLCGIGEEREDEVRVFSEQLRFKYLG